MHLDENDVARYVEGRVTEEERRDLESHLAGCPECSRRVAEARQFLDEIREQEASPLNSEMRREAETFGIEGAERRKEVRRPFRSVAMAGVVVVLLGLAGILYWQFWGAEPTRLRSLSEKKRLTVRAPADGAEVSRRPVFACDSLPGALAYRVTLYAPNGTILWEGDTTAARVALPPEVSLTEGQTYLWRVKALRSDGRSIRSNLQTFRYAP